MHAFCINLDRSVDRLAFMAEQFTRLGLEVERVSAVNGTDVPTWLFREFADTKLTPGEIGCYASHLVVCQKIVALGLPYALVLEDDAELSDDFVSICSCLPWHVPEGWDCVHLGATYKQSVKRVASLTRERALVRFIRQPARTTAYLISNEGARKWLAPRKRRTPADVENRCAWPEGDVYGVYPSLAQQAPRFRSLIAQRGHRQHNPAGNVRAALLHVWRLGPLTYAHARTMDFSNSVRRKLTGKRHVAVI